MPEEREGTGEGDRRGQRTRDRVSAKWEQGAGAHSRRELADDSTGERAHPPHFSPAVLAFQTWKKEH